MNIGKFDAHDFVDKLENYASAISNISKIGTVATAALAYLDNPAWLSGTAIFGTATGFDTYFRHIQKESSILRNFGLLGILRHLGVHFGEELHQYVVETDEEGRPFPKVIREQLYAAGKGRKANASFGTQKDLEGRIMIKNSLYPTEISELEEFNLTFGEERNIEKTHTTNTPFMISAMSYGALSNNAVRALARGAKNANVTINTGEGGYPKYHLMEGGNLIFQIGTAKFGVRKEGSSKLDDDKLEELSNQEAIKMIEIKLSQGAKPGKGGLLPKHKISEEISELRGIPMGEDCVSPSGHVEIYDSNSATQFIRRVQEVSNLPVGIKLCVGDEKEVYELFGVMAEQNIFPDYIAVDGSEGGTGAAPPYFLNHVGMPLDFGLEKVINALNDLEIRDKTKVIAAGRLATPGRQFKAMACGADIVYNARNFLIGGLGCLQTLKCHTNKCPVGIATQNPVFVRGLDIDSKAERVEHLANYLSHGMYELLGASGKKSFRELDSNVLQAPQKNIKHIMF